MALPGFEDFGPGRLERGVGGRRPTRSRLAGPLCRRRRSVMQPQSGTATVLGGVPTSARPFTLVSPAGPSTRCGESDQPRVPASGQGSPRFPASCLRRCASDAKGQVAHSLDSVCTRWTEGSMPTGQAHTAASGNLKASIWRDRKDLSIQSVGW